MKKIILLRPITLAVLLAMASPAYAVGAGEIKNGAGGISRNGDITTVNQTSDRMTIDWNNMDVGKSETLNFVQGMDSASVLNRINSANPTTILGALNANGKVFIVNPNGVLIGNGARVNVGSLVASSLNISDADFMANNLHFFGGGNGKVVNEGDIRSNREVVLIGASEVTNNGRIEVEQHDAILASASDILLPIDNYFGMQLLVRTNKGSLAALVNNGGVIVTKDGAIKLTAWALDALTRSTINNTGTLEANNIDFRRPEVDPSAGTINLYSKGSGNISISGTLRGDRGNYLTTDKKGTVYFGDATLEPGHVTIKADNVLTKNGGRGLKFINGGKEVSVSIDTASDGGNISIGDVVARNDISVIDTGFVKALTQAGPSYFSLSTSGSIEINTGDLDYGGMRLRSRSGTIYFNTPLKAKYLTAWTDYGSIEQAAGADIVTTGYIDLTGFNLTQRASMTSIDDKISLTGYQSFIQERGAHTRAKTVTYRSGGYSGQTMQLEGRTDANALDLYGARIVQGASGVLNALSLHVSNQVYSESGSVDLSQGTNDIGKVTSVSGNTFKLTTTGDTRIVNAFLHGDLVVDSGRNLYVERVLTWGSANLTAKNNIILDGTDVMSAAGTVSSGGDINIRGQNVHSLRSGTLKSDKVVTVNAADDIELTNVDAKDIDLTSTQGSISIGNAKAANDVTISAGHKLSIDSLQAGNDAILSAGAEGIELKLNENVGRNLTLNTNGDVIQGEEGKILVGGDLTYNLDDKSKTQKIDGQPIDVEVGGKIHDSRKSKPQPTPDELRKAAERQFKEAAEEANRTYRDSVNAALTKFNNDSRGGLWNYLRAYAEYVGAVLNLWGKKENAIKDAKVDLNNALNKLNGLT